MDQFVHLREDATSLLINLCDRIDSIVDLFGVGEYQKASERIVFWSDDISTLLEGINILEKRDGFKLSIEELNTKLKLIVDQFENEDYLYVSDLLKYELKPLLKLWLEELKYEQ